MAASMDPEFWSALTGFRQCLIDQEKIFSLQEKCAKEISTDRIGPDKAGVNAGSDRDSVLKKIEELIQQIVASIAQEESPVLSYDRTDTWDNVSFNQSIGLERSRLNAKQTCVRFECITSVRKFSLMLRLLAVVYRLLQSNTYCTKRDIYYQDTQLFGSQAQLDSLVESIACMLQVPRWDLHILATSKGCIAGDLQFLDKDGNLVDCASQSGVNVPMHVDNIHSFFTRARFVLIVEKDATFQKLLDEGFCRKLYPCIMITGKGFPDLNTRLFLKKLWDASHIPLLTLVDADPHGIEIMAIYRFGSRSQSFETRHLAVPAVRWIGILPSDIKKLMISDSMLIPLAKSDFSKISEFMSRPYMKGNDLWTKEIQTMLQLGVKAEIQSLCAISHTYLCDVYIPNKIRNGDWI